MNNYYVYKHIRLDTNTTFYVGKGKNKRAFDRTNGRNAYWYNIVNLFDYKIVIVKENLTQEAALDLEALMIAGFRRYNRCEANFLSGGQVQTHSEESKRKMSASLKGRKVWNKGIPHPQETRNKLKETRRLKKGKWATFKVHNKGVPMSEEQKLKVAEVKGLRKFQVISILTNEVVWEGLFQLSAIKDLGLNKSSKGNINMCLKGQRKSHKGYIFKYLDESLEMAS